ncbi:MAG: hypothetical protein K0S27_1410 [Gammaproteobacteria bacterium]|jgi:hypothetical protein|nr:hypothetical protein [Gammaproteobacteria bacterium]
MLTNNQHALFSDKKLNRKKANGRFSDYVLVPGCPRFPTVHPGVDDTIDYNKKMSIDRIDLIEMGEATISTLLNTGKKICPKVIFFSPKEDNFLYVPHLLSSYIDKINGENQYNFTLHIAGHGDSEKIGSIDPDFRMPIDIFAEMLAVLIQDIDSNKLIYIIFHTCNSAYSDIQPGMQLEEIKEIIRKQTLIGKFALAMKGLGVNNIIVTGYRGYYSHLKNHTGSLVTDDLSNSNVKLDAEKAAITIFPNGNVDLPNNENALFFEVKSLGMSPKNFHRM